MLKVICEGCDKEFERSRPSKNKRNFCTRSCWYSWRSANKSVHSSSSKQSVQCTQCDTPILRHPYRAKRSKNHFCNAQCYNKWKVSNYVGENSPRWQGGDIQVQCSFCEKTIERAANTIKRNKNSFCSRECVSAWRSLNITGDAHPLWKGGWIHYRGPNWNQQREKARKRDGYKCQKCNITQKKLGKELDVHHIVPFREFGYIPNENENYRQANRLINLITLCPTCHTKAEFGKIAIPLPLF